MIESINLDKKYDQGENLLNDNEINFSKLIKLILRNKIIVGSFSLISFLIAIIYSLSLNRIWEGQFQIVLSNDKDITSPLNPLLNIAGISKKNDLKTQVEILKSPSVLMPIFEYSLSFKDENKKNYSFSDWKKDNLRINLKERTAVLNIAYKDTDKEIIIPILEKMSKSYQEYSGKNEIRQSEMTTNYLNSQIAKYKNKSSKSLRLAQEFATEQDLVFTDFYNNNNINNNTNLSDKNNEFDERVGFIPLPNINLENTRVKAANQIRVINSQLKKIKELKNDEELKFIGSKIPFLASEGLPKTLEKIDEELAELRSKYTEAADPVKRLLEKRKTIVKALQNRAINYLEVQKLEAESQIEASSRPKGVLLKYKELIRAAQRDESTLVTLENQLRLYELEAYKKRDPWELITRPTLLNRPVAPNKKQIAILGLSFGIIIGILISYFKEMQSGIIYENDKLAKLLYPLKNINKIKASPFINSDKNLSFIRNDFLYQSQSKILLINFGDIDKIDLENFKKVFTRDKFDKEIEFFSLYDNLNSLNNDVAIYLLVKQGSVKYSDVVLFKKNLELLDFQLKGLIILDFQD